MDHPHDTPTPKTSVPSRLLNGNPRTTNHNSPLRRTSVNAKERDKLTASIKSSNSRRQPVDLDVSVLQVNSQSHSAGDEAYGEPKAPTKFDLSARDPTDEASHASSPTASRPASPYTLNPPIDFDGLSWPSESV